MRTTEGSGHRYRMARLAVIRSSTVCAICLAPLGRVDVQADHILRVRHGGTDDPRNLRAVHGSCNRARELGSPLPPASIVRRSAPCR